MVITTWILDRTRDKFGGSGNGYQCRNSYRSFDGERLISEEFETVWWLSTFHSGTRMELWWDRKVRCIFPQPHVSTNMLNKTVRNAFFDTKDALIGRLSKLYNECWDILWRSDADIHDMACQLEWQFWCRVTLNNSRRCGTAFEVDMRSMSQCCKVGLGVYGTTTIPPRRFSNSGESFFENPWWNDLLESILTVRILAPFEMSAARNAITKSHVTRSASSGACKAIRNWNPMLSSSIPISLR